MWYYMKDGKQMGPVGDEEMKSVAQSGGLAPSDLVWREGMPAWQPASAVAELGMSTAAPGAPAPAPPSPAPPAYPMAPAPPGYDPQFSAAPGGPQGTVFPDYLPWAIAATLLCCLPAGIAAIIFASKANTAKAQGDWAGVEVNSKQAKTWLTVSVVAGLVVFALVVLVNIGAFLAALGSK